MVVSYFQNGLAPSMPTNLRVQSNRAVTVDAMRMNLERRCHSFAAGWLVCKYQPRLSVNIFKANSGQVNTRNAGAIASPASALPSRPSKPGTTHHQGRGVSVPIGARMASIFRNFSIVLLMLLD